MSEVQLALQAFAREVALPHLLALPRLAPHRDQLSVLLIGSAATGMCDEMSDIDITILCDAELAAEIAAGTAWAEGKPTEEWLEGRQLHYYATSFERIRERLARLDDHYLYLYPQAVSLWDPQERFPAFLSEALPDMAAARRQRLEAKLTLLSQRRRALDHCVQRGDVINRTSIALELLVLCLHVVALLDDTVFNPRKRLFETATAGELDQRMEHELEDALGAVGTRDAPAALDRIIAQLQQAAKSL